MSADGWVSPIPRGTCRCAYVYRPGYELLRMAGVIAEHAWRGRGVRVFRWPCGTCAMVEVDSTDDAALMKRCGPFLFATYAQGTLVRTVVEDMRWAAEGGR